MLVFSILLNTSIVCVCVCYCSYLMMIFVGFKRLNLYGMWLSSNFHHFHNIKLELEVFGNTCSNNFENWICRLWWESNRQFVYTDFMVWFIGFSFCEYVLCVMRAVGTNRFVELFVIAISILDIASQIDFSCVMSGWNE